MAREKIKKIILDNIEKIDFDNGFKKRFIIRKFAYFIEIRRECLLYKKLTKREYQRLWIRKKKKLEGAEDV